MDTKPNFREQVKLLWKELPAIPSDEYSAYQNGLIDGDKLDATFLSRFDNVEDNLNYSWMIMFMRPALAYRVVGQVAFLMARICDEEVVGVVETWLEDRDESGVPLPVPIERRYVSLDNQPFNEILEEISYFFGVTSRMPKIDTDARSPNLPFAVHLHSGLSNPSRFALLSSEQRNLIRELAHGVLARYGMLSTYSEEIRDGLNEFWASF